MEKIKKALTKIAKLFRRATQPRCVACGQILKSYEQRSGVCFKDDCQDAAAWAQATGL